MIKVIWCDELKADYQKLWDKCVVTPALVPSVDKIARQIALNQLRYKHVVGGQAMPWCLIGVIHNLECGLSFEKHLHNGDPLSKPTVHVPANRPWTQPPWDWTWEESAEDAIKLLHLDTWKDWSIPGILYKLEGFNGYGYRQYHPNVNSPYLWAGTNLYTKGKYVVDGRFDSNAISRQLGAAAVLKRGVVLGLFDLHA
jgi:lysozyme family protein